MKFETNIAKVLSEIEGDAVGIMRVSMGVISAKTVTRTPRLTGSLANSWTPAKNEPRVENVTISPDSPRPARVQTTKVINSLELGDDYYFSNGKDYAPRIEFEGFSKRKAPQGMMTITIAEWQQIVDGAKKR